MLRLSYDTELFSSVSELTGPNIDPLGPYQRALKIERKLQKFVFPPKWRRKLLPVPVFGHILVLHRRLGHFRHKSQKCFGGTLLRYLRSKFKNSKIIYMSYKNFSFRFFLIFCSRCSPLQVCQNSFTFIE